MFRFPLGEKTLMRWVRQWGPAALWALLIWVLSTEHFSSAATAHVIEPILRWLFSSASRHTIRVIHHFIRKAAHLTEYAIFSVMLFRSFRGKQSGWRVTWVIEALAIAVVYACLDEVHQAFVPGREARWIDSMLDSLGAGIGQLLLWLSLRRRPRVPETETA